MYRRSANRALHLEEHEEYHLLANQCLRKAVLTSDLTMARYFLEIGGANPNYIVDENDNSLLHEASHRRDEGMMLLLLQHGAEPDQEWHDECVSPLFIAARQELYGVVRFLLSDPATGRPQRILRRHHGFSILHFIIDGWYQRSYVKPSSCSRMVRVLLDAGAEIDARNIDGLTPLLTAVCATDGDTLLLLLERGADPNVEDDEGAGVLHYASFTRGDNNSLNAWLFVERGLDVNKMDANGRTPLHSALHFRKPRMVELLLKHGANVNASSPSNPSQVPLAFLQYDPEDEHCHKSALLMVKYLAKMHPRVSEENLLACQQHPLVGQMLRACLREIDSMRSVKLAETTSDVTYYDMLHAGNQRMVALTRNSEMVKAVDKRRSIHRKLFPYFVDELELKFDEARRINRRIVEVEQLLDEVLRPRLPHTALRLIIHHLEIVESA